MAQMLDLFDDVIPETPKTESIKYAGSKLKLLPHIIKLVSRIKPNTVFDGFSGSTRVSQALAKCGYQVIANDAAAWSQVLGTCYLLNTKKADYYEDLISHLNSVKPIDGWFTEHYGGLPNTGSSVQSDGLKKPWQIHNTRKLDAIREEIDALDLPFSEKAVALTSLLIALDQVDSTLGHFVSYLQEWSPRSYNHLVLNIPSLFISRKQNKVVRGDIFDILPNVQTDLAYFDPPYGSNNEKMPPSRVRYASYYHLWTTVCLNDKPKLFGKAKRREDTSDVVSASVFEEFRRNDSGRFIALDAIDRLISSVNAKWVLLSYSSGGRATAEELNDILTKNGKVIDVQEIDYKLNVMAGMKWTNEWLREAQEPNREFLFLLEKN